MGKIKSIATALMALSSLTAAAETNDAICVWTSAKDYISFKLTDHPKVTYIDDQFVLTIGKKQVLTLPLTPGEKVKVTYGVYDEENIPEEPEEEIHDITLIDGTAYTNATQMEDMNITYRRTFNNTNWQPLYVPFSMEYSDWSEHFDVAAINMFHQYDTDNDGIFDAAELEVLKVQSNAVGKLRPNYPYLIKAKSTGTYDITIDGTTLYPKKETSIDCSSMSVGYTFTGTYDDVRGMATTGYFVMAGGTLCGAANDDVVLRPFRWYLEISNLESQFTHAKPSKAKIQSIDISVYGEEDETGIRTFEGKENANHEGDAVYDLSGRKLEVKDADALPHGIYIINNKKQVK